MTEQLPNCPECGSAYAYEDRGLFICPECGHEWSPTEEVAEEGLVAVSYTHLTLPTKA